MSGLKTLNALSQTLAILAVPVLVAYFGSSIQREISQGQLKKEYVQLAIDVLKQPTSDNELKGWAQRLLSENSPTPFTRNEKMKLQAGGAFVVELPCPNEDSMKRQESLLVYLDQIVGVEDLESGVSVLNLGMASKAASNIQVESPQFIEAYLKLREGLTEQRIHLEYLQRYAKTFCEQKSDESLTPEQSQ
ncbi:hypothetical protein SAMN05216487_3294 [Pseudomonas sp. UC 17F4]|uniref:hypothetical protein n=1 Tax=Pseudomonas sp. UC 17F4 TaxID=1855328 RepID=UPI000881AECE|nr:hypothetical protein [Pseudomonas sp. UC 17F4]SDQ68956.1 hypothetical protein SAMN05216487_3294 [Pseudomonas sp. UC 17F4]